VPQLQWLSGTDGASSDELQQAMMTHAQEMKLKLARWGLYKCVLFYYKGFLLPVLVQVESSWTHSA
jgi:hypothetical protein